MSEKNARIRKHLAATADIARSLNRFRFGKAITMKIDFESPVKGVEVPESITIDVFDFLTGNGMVFSVPVSEVEFYREKL